ncbi:MAG TPA: BON domain-containing protein [Anaerolineales bacterium]
MFKSKLLDYFQRWNISTPVTNTVERITAGLKDDPRTQDEQIDVLDDRGELIITGKVKSEHARQAAVEIAQKEGGLLRITNELRIKRRRK